MSCRRSRSGSSLVAIVGAVIAVLAVVAAFAPARATAQSDLCSSQRTRDSCESQSPISPAGSQCYWSGLACHLADACGSDCSKPGCQRCATFPDLCYPLTIACPLTCDAYPVEAMCNGWAQPSRRAGAAGCNWDKGANKCLAVGLATNGTVNVQAPAAPGSSAVPANGPAAPGQTTSGGTPIGLILGIIAVVAVVGVAGMVFVTRHRRQAGRKSAAAGGARARAGTPGVPLSSSSESPQPPPPAGVGGFAKPSTTYNGTRQMLSPSTQLLSASSIAASTPTTSLTAVNAAAPASLDASRATSTATSAPAAITSPITSPASTSTPIPRPAAAWPATGMSPMHQRSSPPNMSRDSIYTDLSTTVTEHPMSMDYVVPEKSRMTMISIADTDRELGSEVGTPMDEEFGARRQSSYFATSSSSSPPNGTVGGAPVGMRMLPSSASVATSEFSAVTDSGSLGPIALPPAPSSRVNSMAGSSAVGSVVPVTPMSAVPSRVLMPDTPGTPGSPYSLADIEYYSQVGSSGNVAAASAPAAEGEAVLRR